MRSKSTKLQASIFGALLLSLTASAQAPLVYPKKSQSQKQQGKDTTECQTWAREQTGFDPSAPVAQAPQTDSSGHAVRGAGRGAAAGAIGGAIGGNAGKGAAIGAGVGAAGGAVRRRGIARENEANQQQATAQRNHEIAQYNKAFGTCMSGRGYSVSQ